MTVIVWDGKTLAADRRSCYGSMVNVVTKIWRVNDCLVGGSGDWGQVQAMREWIRAGADPATFPKMQESKEDYAAMLVIKPDGKMLIYERTPYPCEQDSLPITIGSGREFAFAAIRCGRDARGAVEVAIACSHDCGDGIDTLEFG